MKNSAFVFLWILCSTGLCWSGCSDEKSTNVPKTEPEGFLEPSASKPGRLVTQAKACYFDEVDSIRKSINIELQVADTREKEIVDDIMRYAELPSNFSLFRGDVSNAMAISHQQKRLIVYNKDLFIRIDRQSNVYWSSVFILAHEIGHHLANNMTPDYSPIQAELEADAFAAGILYKMGADTAQALSALQSHFISNAYDTKTHPSKSKRLNNALRSWRNANDRHSYNATPPILEDDENEEIYLNKWDLWEGFYQMLDKEELQTTETSGFEGIVIHAKNLGDSKPDVRFFETLIHLTKVPSGSQVGQPNQRVKFNVYYYPQAVGGDFDFDWIFSFFKPGRRIAFTVMDYYDQLGGYRHIVEVKEIKQKTTP